MFLSTRWTHPPATVLIKGDPTVLIKGDPTVLIKGDPTVDPLPVQTTWAHDASGDWNAISNWSVLAAPDGGGKAIQWCLAPRLRLNKGCLPIRLLRPATFSSTTPGINMSWREARWASRSPPHPGCSSCGPLLENARPNRPSCQLFQSGFQRPDTVRRASRPLRSLRGAGRLYDTCQRTLPVPPVPQMTLPSRSVKPATMYNSCSLA